MRLGRLAALPWREWVPAALVSALMLIGGARLIVLSTQERMADDRAAAGEEAERTTSSVETELENLLERARRESARAVDVLERRDLREERGTVAPDTEGFWTANDGSIVPAAPSTGDAAAQDALARAWLAGDRDSKDAPGIEWLAPLRHGSQWLVAVRVPIFVSNGTDAEQAGWVVVYQALEEMLQRSGVGELPKKGYELAFGQAPGGDEFRLLTGSPFVASLDHVTGMIRLPDESRAPGSSEEPYMVLALRPGGGWYSLAGLTVDVGLLLLLTWLLGLAAYDLTQSPKRWAAALAVARRRLVATNRRLSEELEERRRLQLSFQHARFHDTFTGLPNRRYFMNRLDRALRDRGGRKQLLAVILVDIDRFRLVNDTLGQTAGDELMVQAARRFENTLGEDAGHVLARWSGDQFALLLFDVHSSDTAVTFAKLLSAALTRPFILRKHTLSVAAHVGVTCVDAQMKRTEDVVREADVALSVAKRREVKHPVVYEAALSEEVVSTVSLEADLHVALERQQFRLLFQPIVDLTAGRIVGAEALLRWHHPVEGVLAPDRFLAIAEDARLLLPISRWVIARACRLGGEWCRFVGADAGFYVSINLAAAALHDPKLVRYVAEVLQRTGLPAASLRFELTEGDLAPHVGAAREVLDALHEMGVGLVLDDFGTGRSSLSYLELFPIDCVKIDRPFVNAADGSDSDVTRSLVQMASSLGLEAVAEKVETEAAVQALKRMGCRWGQGYLLGEPLEPEQLLARLAARAKMPAAPRDAATTVLPPVAQRAAPDAATRVLPPLPERPAPDAATLVLPPLQERATPDAATLVLPPSSEREQLATDAPTLVLPASSERIAATDAPTQVLPASPEAVAEESATLVLAESAPACADDERTVEQLRPPDEAEAAAATAKQMSLARSNRRLRRGG